MTKPPNGKMLYLIMFLHLDNTRHDIPGSGVLGAVLYAVFA